MQRSYRTSGSTTPIRGCIYLFDPMEMSQVINYCARDGHSPLPNPVRLESNGEIRSTMISPGAVDTELSDHISDKKTAENTEKLYGSAIDSEAIARAILYAVEQPEEVDINEIVIRPTQQEM